MALVFLNSYFAVGGSGKRLDASGNLCELLRVLGDGANGASKGKATQIMSKSMPKSLKSQCDFGTCDFLLYAKSLALKSF